MTILKSFGCSFIYGDDLQDTFKETDPWSAYTWPALLAQDRGLKHECWAKSGSGNLQILDTLLRQAAESSPAIYVIGWTWIDRLDYIDHAANDWCTIRPADQTDRSQWYYKKLHSQYLDKLQTLTYINTAIHALQSNDHKFIMTYQDPLIFETQWHCSDSIRQLQNFVRPYLTNFEGLSFLEWSRLKGFKISPNWHPLEDAHRAAFEYIKNHSLV
jgi:hypothetical protein